MNQKIAIIGVSSILLVAAVIGTVTYGIHNTKSQQGSGDADSNQVSTSTKATHSICQSTDYKDTCEKSLSNAKADDNDPKHLIQVAFQAAIDEVKGVISNSTLLKEAAKDPRTSKAFDICEQVLQSSADDIQRSVDRIGTFDKTKLNEYLNDIETWLSGAITYQQTCLDAFQNTTGDNGEKMKKLMNTTSEMSSNGLAMVNQLSEIFSSLQILGLNNRRLLEDGREMMSETARRLVEADTSTLKPNVVVAKDGSGQCKSIQEAINSAPKNVNETFIILVKEGVYNEYVEIPTGVYNIFLVGEGPTKTKISGNRNFVGGYEPFESATVVVNGDNFIAKDIGIENTSGAIKRQAVALRVSADKAIFYNCQIDGYQSTLFAHAHRQFYRNCTISGTIDSIFGDAAAVFQNCKMVVRKPIDDQACTVTAQGRTDPRGKGAIVLQNCTITAEKEFLDTKPMPDAFLGRPWKLFSRTLIVESEIDGFIAPQGWTEWMGTFGLDTLTFVEYQNRGPGSNTDKRVTWAGIKHFAFEEVEAFTPDTYIEAAEWIKGSGIPYEAGMIKA